MKDYWKLVTDAPTLLEKPRGWLTLLREARRQQMVEAVRKRQRVRGNGKKRKTKALEDMTLEDIAGLLPPGKREVFLRKTRG